MPDLGLLGESSHLFFILIQLTDSDNPNTYHLHHLILTLPKYKLPLKLKKMDIEFKWVWSCSERSLNVFVDSSSLLCFKHLQRDLNPFSEELTNL